MCSFMTWLRARAVSFSVLAAAILLDVLTKQLVITHLKPIGTYPILPGVFHFTYAENTGAAWSLFSAPDQRWIFMTISSVAILLMLGYLFAVRIDEPLVKLGLGAVIGGGIGNMIDRLTQGYVVDFLDARIISFPIFNVADCFVTVGAVLLCLGLLITWRKEDLAARQKGEQHASDPGQQ